MPNVFQYIAPRDPRTGAITPRPIDTGCAAEMDLVDLWAARLERAPYCGASTGQLQEWLQAQGGCGRPKGHAGIHVCGDWRRRIIFARWIVV